MARYRRCIRVGGRYGALVGSVAAGFGAALLVAAPGCSDDVESVPATTVATTTTTTTTGGYTTTTSSGAGGAGGAGGDEGPCPAGGFAPYTPTPEDVYFQAIEPIPQGEQLLYNDWTTPDRLYSLSPDGSTSTEIFRVWRIWSLGASNGGTSLAFACGDPLQLEHYGISVGDAIQHTWLYDFETESLTLVSDGLVNDECHSFTADDSAIYVCRRYDWQCDPEWYTTNKGYRIGRIALPGGEFSFVTEESDTQLDLHPQPNADETSMLFTRVTIDGGSQSRQILQMSLPGGTPTVLRGDSNAPVLTPDGQRYLYVDYDQNGWLFSSDLDGNDEILVAEAQATNVRVSPDGERVAYLRTEQALNCQHIETVAIDGSEAQAPTRLRDCGSTGEFITELAWIVRP